MKLPAHDARSYADALKALLPPGAAFDWPEGGTGDTLLLATAQELARVDAACQSVIDGAIARHTPHYSHWTLGAYQTIADAAIGAGRCEISHRWAQPLRVGCRIGYRCWSHGARVILRVRYGALSTTELDALSTALEAHKQAHMVFWYEAI